MRVPVVVFAVLIGCVHAPPEPPVAPADAPAPAVADAPPPPPPPPPVAEPPPLPRTLPPPADLVGTDARTLVNAWRVKHNEGVALLAKGDAPGALAAGKASLALAPASFRREPLVLVASAASQARDVPTAVEAVDELVGAEGVPWGVFYNGSLDAAQAGRPDLASRYALEALARDGDLGTVGPMALRATLAAGDLDGALVVVARLGADADPDAVRSLARALSLAGRCPDAQRLDPAVCT